MVEWVDVGVDLEDGDSNGVDVSDNTSDGVVYGDIDDVSI